MLWLSNFLLIKALYSTSSAGKGDRATPELGGGGGICMSHPLGGSYNSHVIPGKLGYSVGMYSGKIPYSMGATVIELMLPHHSFP